MKTAPATGAPGGVAVLDDANSLARSTPLTRSSPPSLPTVRPTGTGGGRPWGPIMNSARGVGAASDGASFDKMGDRTQDWRVKNRTKQAADTLSHGEAFFKPNNLQSQFDNFRTGVHDQLKQARSSLDASLADDALTADDWKSLARENGIRYADDVDQFKVNDAIDYIFDRYKDQPGNRRDRLQQIVDRHLEPPSDQELLTKFQDSVIDMKATRDANAPFLENRAKALGDSANGTSVMFDEANIDWDLVAPDAAQLDQVRSDYGSLFDQIRLD